MLSSGVPMLVEFAELGAITKGQPDEARLQKARDFGRHVALAAAGV